MQRQNTIWLSKLSHRISIFFSTKSPPHFAPGHMRRLLAQTKRLKAGNRMKGSSGELVHSFETSKFGGTHISQCESSSPTHWKKWIHWFQVVSLDLLFFLFFLLSACFCSHGCWLRVGLLEFKLIVDWQRIELGLCLYQGEFTITWYTTFSNAKAVYLS